MKIVKMFDAEEIEEATGVNPRVAIDIPGNDCAIHFYAEFIDVEEYDDEEEIEEVKSRNKIVEYLISQGIKEEEEVWIDITW